MSSKSSKKAPVAPVAPVVATKVVAPAAPAAPAVPPPPPPLDVMKHRSFIAWLVHHATEEDVHECNTALKRFKKPAGRKPAVAVAPGEKPSEEDYKFKPESFNPDVCCARVLTKKDTRFKPPVFTAEQCTKARSEEGLCKSHLAHKRNYAAGFANKWHGCVGEIEDDTFVPEDLLPCSQTFGGPWARTIRPIWKGGEKPKERKKKTKAAVATEDGAADATTDVDTDADDATAMEEEVVAEETEEATEEVAEEEAEEAAEEEEVVEEEPPPPPPKSKSRKHNK